MRARAIAYLARREHSRAELERKLRPHAASAELLQALLDSLAQEGLLSQQRFVESLVRRRAQGFGLRRVAHELGEHRIDASTQASVLAELRVSEPERARAAWAKRFGKPPADIAERARQYRFLVARGFSAEAISAVFKHLPTSSGVGSDPSTEPG